MVKRKINVKAVVKLRPINIVFTIPTALKANHNVTAPKNKIA